MTLKELAIKVLKESKIPLRIEEIWQIAEKKGYSKLTGSKGKTPWATIRYQIYISMRDDKNSPFAMTNNYPRKYYLKKKKIKKNDLIY